MASSAQRRVASRQEASRVAASNHVKDLLGAGAAAAKRQRAASAGVSGNCGQILRLNCGRAGAEARQATSEEDWKKLKMAQEGES
jgi:hypothetical protein